MILKKKAELTKINAKPYVFKTNSQERAEVSLKRRQKIEKVKLKDFIELPTKKSIEKIEKVFNINDKVYSVKDFIDFGIKDLLTIKYLSYTHNQAIVLEGKTQRFLTINELRLWN